MVFFLSLLIVHAIGIIHRDIKPQNILEDDKGNIKLGTFLKIYLKADFGVANKCEPNSTTISGSEGTYHFMAPETLTRKDPNGYCGKKSDIWSLGVCLYCFIFLELPFFENSLKGLIDSIIQKPLEISNKREISPELKDLLEKIQTKDAGERLQLEDIKKHPWFLN